MIKLIGDIFILAAVAAASVWLIENPGYVQINWLGYQLNTSTGILFFCIVLLTFVLVLLLRLVRGVKSAPKTLVRGLKGWRQRRGLLAVVQALLALAAEHKAHADKQARQAAKLLAGGAFTGLSAFLQGQAALLNDDYQQAQQHYENLIAVGRTAFLGYQGLCKIEQKRGNRERAITYAIEAQRIMPRSAWVLRTLLDLYRADGQMQKAVGIIEEGISIKLWNKQEYRTLSSDLLLQEAILMRQQGRDREALPLAEEACRQDSKNWRAALQVVSLLADLREIRKAKKMLVKQWVSASADRERDQAILRVYEDSIEPKNKEIQDNIGDNSNDGSDSLLALGRLERAEKFIGEAKYRASAAKYLAELSLQAELWGRARDYLKNISKYDQDNDYHRLMQSLEQADKESKQQKDHKKQEETATNAAPAQA